MKRPRELETRNLDRNFYQFCQIWNSSQQKQLSAQYVKHKICNGNASKETKVEEDDDPLNDDDEFIVTEDEAPVDDSDSVKPVPVDTEMPPESHSFKKTGGKTRYVAQRVREALGDFCTDGKIKS